MIADILTRLDKVRQTGRGNWLSRCPAHGDKNPSLTLHEAEDGRILCRCWAGCGFPEIVAAVGLGFDPWFPPKQSADFLPPVRRPYPAADVLEATADSAMLIAVTVANLAHGAKIEPAEYLAMLEAAGRIQAAREVALGQRR